MPKQDLFRWRKQKMLGHKNDKKTYIKTTKQWQLLIYGTLTHPSN